MPCNCYRHFQSVALVSKEKDFPTCTPPSDRGVFRVYVLIFIYEKRTMTMIMVYTNQREFPLIDHLFHLKKICFSKVCSIIPLSSLKCSSSSVSDRKQHQRERGWVSAGGLEPIIFDVTSLIMDIR